MLNIYVLRSRGGARLPCCLSLVATDGAGSDDVAGSCIVIGGEGCLLEAGMACDWTASHPRYRRELA